MIRQNAIREASVDAHADELPSDAWANRLSREISRDVMVDELEAAELLDVDVDHVAGPLTLVAAMWDGRLLQILQAREARAPEHAADGGRRDADLSGNVATGKPLAPQGDVGRSLPGSFVRYARVARSDRPCRPCCAPCSGRPSARQLTIRRTDPACR